MHPSFPARGSFFLVFLVVFLVGKAAGQPSIPKDTASFSLVLRGGTIVDGTGRTPYVADLGLVGERVAAIGALDTMNAAVVVDVTGLVVAPGFIDIHSHADGSTPERSPIGQRPEAENYLRQGVTTVFGGQDGDSPLSMGPWLAYFDAIPPAVNIGLFVGHGSVRAEVVGEDDRPATADELSRMRRIVQRAMEEGAFGLSSGLEYTPGGFAPTEEIVELARVTAPFGGLYISHVRDEGPRLLESVAEVIRVAEEGGVAGQLTHHKIIGKGRWGGTRASLAAAAAARDRGVDISIDVYPYTASSTGMTILFPAWAKDGGDDALRSRLADPAVRARIRADVISHLDTERGGDPSTVVAAMCSWDTTLNGLSLADMARLRGLEPTVANAADVALWLVENGSCQGVFHSMSEEDVQRVMLDPAAMIASDGSVPRPGSGMPHPRSYGTFARVLARYVRDLGVLTIEQAVHKMSGVPAARVRLHDRGVIRPGAVADIAVFDPVEIQDRSTFGDPHHYATGVRHVFVAGRWSLRDGEPTGVRAGRALRRDR